ncbi:hypothetical protein [Phyllobacterium ifriqiyense]|uniref:hypothetical protein n=1 Tax=Phyllobacterium ifriqiyense TaxID=314238 RepID=UPI003393712A
MDIDEIERLSREFRAKIDATPKDQFSINMIFFPGSCGDTSLLLSRYLDEAGMGKFNYISARKGERTHAWLQSGKLIIDITVDQFPEFDDPCFVKQEHPWHDTWTAEDKGEANWQQMAGAQAYALASDYDIILNSETD